MRATVLGTTMPVADLSGFDEAFRRARSRLLRICGGLVGPDHAEDIVQETYLRARSHYANLRDLASFDAWVARIAVNLCFNAQRDRRRLLEQLPRLAGVGGVAPNRDVGLVQLIERLPARARTLVVLHYGYGYQVDEIALVLGLSSTNARSILFRARASLARQLREAQA